MKIKLEWEIESRDFEKVKSELPKDAQLIIGDNYCALCVLAAGSFACIHRAVCRARTHGEVFKSIKVKKS